MSARRHSYDHGIPSSNHANRFDADGIPPARSADTSVSSVATEPHAAEPSARRRVISPITSANVSCGRISPNTSADQAGLLGSPTSSRKTHNPYMYNVLGPNASPDMAARTSPIPVAPSAFEVPPTNHSVGGYQQPPFNNYSSQHHTPLAAGVGVAAPNRTLSFEWADEEAAAALMMHQQHQQHQQQLPRGDSLMMGQPLTGPTTPILGGYMAQCYSSAFPPGHGLPRPQLEEPAVPPSKEHHHQQHQHQQQNGGSARGRRGARRNQSPDQMTQQQPPAQPQQPQIVQAPAPPPVPLQLPQQPSTSTSANNNNGTVSPVSSPTSPMTRVYRNGRPVPVPAAAAQRA